MEVKINDSMNYELIMNYAAGGILIMVCIGIRGGAGCSSRLTWPGLRRVFLWFSLPPRLFAPPSLLFLPPLPHTITIHPS